jgi:hypothetical protein
MAKPKKISSAAPAAIQEPAVEPVAAPEAVVEPEPEITTDDLMTQCVMLCQENRWREAALVGRTLIHLARETGHDEFADGFEQGAMQKIEYSLRRQMASSLIVAARDFLKKEFLLDVAE